MEVVGDKRIIRNVLDVKDDFDTFLFDAYGVFWDGSKLVTGMLDVMEELVKSGKNVCVLTNMPQSCVDTENHYMGRGLIKGKYYNYMFTSGQTFINNCEKDFNIANKKVFCLHTVLKPKLFNNIKYVKANNIEEADIIYIDIPVFVKQEVDNFIEKYDFSMDDFYCIQGAYGCFNNKVFDVIAENVKNLNNKAVIVIACPDREIKVGDVFIKGPASFCDSFKKCGFETKQYGKPEKSMYDFVFAELEKLDIAVNKDRIVMIGDTLETDIAGANGFGIKNILIFNDNGVAYNYVRDMCAESNGVSDDIKQLLAGCKKFENEKGVFVDYYLVG